MGVALVAAQPAFAQPTYAIKDLGPAVAYVYDLSRSGEVVGENPNLHAIIYSRGRVRDLGTLGGAWSAACAVNEDGTVVGVASMPEDFSAHAFVYTRGRMRDLGTLGGNESMALDINRHGDITGSAALLGDTYHAFVYSRGKMHDLGSKLGPGHNAGVAINDFREVAGSYQASGSSTHAFLYSGDAVIDLGTLGGSSSYSADVNNWGEVVGSSYTGPANMIAHGFLYSNGRMTDLGALAPQGWSEAHGVNRWSQVVGMSSTVDDGAHAFLYSGMMHDLNDLIPNHPGWRLVDAKRITDTGEILCEGYDPQESFRCVVLTPITPPDATR